MSASLAAASSASRLAPSSLACRKLMIDAKPNFLISGTAVALIAPEQATVVSRRWKFVMPSTVSLVTSCARTGAAPSQTLEIKAAAIRNCDFMESLLKKKLHYAMNCSDKASLSNVGFWPDFTFSPIELDIAFQEVRPSCPDERRAGRTNLDV